MSKKCFMMVGGSLSGTDGRSVGSETSERSNISLERDIETSRFLRRETVQHTYFFSGSYCLRVLNRVSSIRRWHLLNRHADIIIDSYPQPFPGDFLGTLSTLPSSPES